MYVPKWLQRLLRRSFRRSHVHIPTPQITSQTQRDLVARINESDKRRLERLTNEIENRLRLNQ